MGKMEDALKAEIGRLSRKELKSKVDPLQREIRELKRTVKRLTKAVAKLETAYSKRRPARAVKPAEVPDEEVRTARITGRVIKNLRKKLGVSQEKLAILLDVSPAAVAFWEQGRARPRGENKAAVVALRKLGRRDVKRILSEKGVATGRKRRSGAKKT